MTSRQPRSRALAVALTAVLTVLLSLLPGGQAHAAPTLAAGVTQQLVTNDPTSGAGIAANERIIRAKEDAIRRAPAGAVVRIANWRLDRQASAEVILGAVDRGVDLRLALNSASGEFSPTKWLRARLAERGKSSVVVMCKPNTGETGGGCNSNRKSGTQHAKTMTISRTTQVRDGATVTLTDVVYDSSVNLSNGQTYTYNDMVITAGSPTLYAQRKAWIKDMLGQVKDNNYRVTRGTKKDAASLTDSWMGVTSAADGSMREAPASVTSTDTTDTYATMLRGMRGDSTCSIDVAMSWIDDRRTAVVNHLVRLKGQGCAVVVSARMSSTSAAEAIEKFRVAGIPWNRAPQHVHSKVINVRGAKRVADGSDVFEVYQGSEHLEANYRGDDEMVTRRTNPALVSGFRTWFDLIAARSGLPATP